MTASGVARLNRRIVYAFGMSQIQSGATRAKGPKTCAVCGQPLGAEPWWMVEPPDRGEHERCRDWTRHAFPFARELNSLRGIARRITALQREVFRVGRPLAAVERRWPDSGLVVVERARREFIALHAKLVELLDKEKVPPLS